MKKLNNLKWFSLGVSVCLLFSAVLVPAAASQLSKSANLMYNDIKITLNGTALTPTDASGNAVEPFTIDGTTYLPVRAVANALGLGVTWDGKTSTVALTSSNSSNSSGTVIVNQSGVKVTYTGMKLTQYLPGQADGYMLTVGLKIENNSSSDIVVSPMDSSVNDVMKTAVSATPMKVLKGKTELAGFSFAKLDGTGIDSVNDSDKIKNVEFRLSVEDDNSNSEIFKSDVIKLNP